MQTIVDILKRCFAGQTGSAQRVQIIRGLYYFAIPVHLWPTGLQLVQRTLSKQQGKIQIAEDIVQQLCAHLLSANADYSFQPCSVRDAHAQGEHEFIVDECDCQSSKYRVVDNFPSRLDWRHYGLLMPASLEAAVIEAGHAEDLEIRFEYYENRLQHLLAPRTFARILVRAPLA